MEDLGGVRMNLFGKVLCGVGLSAAILLAQIPVYKSYEDYCQQNPHAPTCKDGKPISMDESMKAIMESHSHAWCEMNPKDPACPDKDSTKNSNKTKAKVPTAPAPQPVAAPAPGPDRAEESLPQTRRTKGGPSDIRLGEWDWRLVEPNADLLIGINMASLVESELARSIIRQWTEKLGASAAEQDKLLGKLGDLTQAVISIHGKEILAIMMGHLDDFPEGSRVGGMQSMRVSADTIAMGSPFALKFVQHRLSFPLSLTPRLKEAQRLSGTYHFWLWGKPSALAAFGQQSGVGQGASGPGMRAGNPITALKFGVNLNNQFRMDLVMDTPSAEIAGKMARSMLKNSSREMQVAVEGTSVHSALVLNRDVALARFGGFITDDMGKQFATLLTAARQMAGQQQPASARPPGKIVIEGLDDGPRTVTASTKQ
jgi:hypothetical protein